MNRASSLSLLLVFFLFLPIFSCAPGSLSTIPEPQEQDREFETSLPPKDETEDPAQSPPFGLPSYEPPPGAIHIPFEPYEESPPQDLPRQEELPHAPPTIEEVVEPPLSPGMECRRASDCRAVALTPTCCGACQNYAYSHTRYEELRAYCSENPELRKSCPTLGCAFQGGFAVCIDGQCEISGPDVIILRQ